MKSHELHRQLSDQFGLFKNWPAKLEVDADTYANCCNAVFDWSAREDSFSIINIKDNKSIRVVIGPNSGLMFKNVELILKP